MMPRLDGYQTCALIKKNGKFQRTPVIMLSSKDGLFDRARGRMVGSDQYLTKPFTKESLLKAVAAHVNRAAALMVAATYARRNWRANSPGRRNRVEPWPSGRSSSSTIRRRSGMC